MENNVNKLKNRGQRLKVICEVGNAYKTVIYMCICHMKGKVEVEVMLCYANRCLPILIERQ